MATNKRGQCSTSVQQVPGKKRSIAGTDITAPRNKKFTKSELKTLEQRRQEQYQLLLDSARNHDTESALVLPAQNTHQIQMVKMCLTIQKKLELIDIYEYLVLRQADVPQRVSFGTFGSLIGCNIAKSTMHAIHKRKEEYRALAKDLPEETYYMLKRKQMNLEKVIVKWLQDQRSRQNPVSKRMIVEAAKTTYTILADLRQPFDSDSNDSSPSFSASWFDAFKKRHHITHCQLHGSSASVDLEAIEPELVQIRELCAQYTPDNIYSCDETGFYLKELDHKSYTTLLSEAGTKANRDCRVTILFCINASGTSLAKSASIDALKPLVIERNLAMDVDADSKAMMSMKTSKSGWMTSFIFKRWLEQFDDQLKEPTLLLLDSAPQHADIDMRNTDEPWKHLRIRRLPVNSTSVTQPLDAGVISVFKRSFLEMLSNETSRVKTPTIAKATSNGHAWSMIPFAWNSITAKTIRNCFAKTPVLPQEMRIQLKVMPTTDAERQRVLQHTRRNLYQAQERAYFERLIASVTEDNDWTLVAVGNKDEQHLIEEQEAEQERSSPSVAMTMDDSTDAPLSSTHSSPLSKDALVKSSTMLSMLSGGLSAFNPDCLETMMRNAKDKNMDNTYRMLKGLVRSFADTEAEGTSSEEVNPFL